MKSLFRFLPVLTFLALLLSCGGEQRQSVVVEARSMEEALSLARDAGSFIVVEFWMDG
jgi:hypothetical protein